MEPACGIELVGFVDVSGPGHCSKDRLFRYPSEQTRWFIISAVHVNLGKGVHTAEFS